MFLVVVAVDVAISECFEPDKMNTTIHTKNCVPRNRLAKVLAAGHAAAGDASAAADRAAAEVVTHSIPYFILYSNLYSILYSILYSTQLFVCSLLHIILNPFSITFLILELQFQSNI